MTRERGDDRLLLVEPQIENFDRAIGEACKEGLREIVASRYKGGDRTI